MTSAEKALCWWPQLFGVDFDGGYVAVGQNQWYHFGVGAPPILVYFSGDWDVHWGYGVLTHGHALIHPPVLYARLHCLTTESEGSASKSSNVKMPNHSLPKNLVGKLRLTWKLPQLADPVNGAKSPFWEVRSGPSPYNRREGYNHGFCGLSHHCYPRGPTNG